MRFLICRSEGAGVQGVQSSAVKPRCVRYAVVGVSVSRASYQLDGRRSETEPLWCANGVVRLSLGGDRPRQSELLVFERSECF